MFQLFAATPTIVFTLDPILVIQLVLAVILPVVVGLVTTRVTRSSVKAWLLAGLTLLTTIITGLSDALSKGVPFDLGLALLLAIPSFVISVAMHYGLWKPTGVAGAAQDVGSK